MITSKEIVERAKAHNLTYRDVARLTEFGIWAVNRVFKGQEPTKNHRPGYYYLFKFMDIKAAAEVLGIMDELFANLIKSAETTAKTNQSE